MFLEVLSYRRPDRGAHVARFSRAAGKDPGERCALALLDVIAGETTAAKLTDVESIEMRSCFLMGDRSREIRDFGSRSGRSNGSASEKECEVDEVEAHIGNIIVVEDLE